MKKSLLLLTLLMLLAPTLHADDFYFDFDADS